MTDLLIVMLPIVFSVIMMVYVKSSTTNPGFTDSTNVSLSENGTNVSLSENGANVSLSENGTNVSLSENGANVSLSENTTDLSCLKLLTANITFAKLVLTLDTTTKVSARLEFENPDEAKNAFAGKTEGYFTLKVFLRLIDIRPDSNTITCTVDTLL